MMDSTDYIDIELIEEAVLNSIAQLDGKLAVLIELHSEILATLTKRDAAKLASAYKKKATVAGRKRMEEVRREIARENKRRYAELQRPDF